MMPRIDEMMLPMSVAEELYGKGEYHDLCVALDKIVASEDAKFLQYGNFVRFLTKKYEGVEIQGADYNEWGDGFYPSSMYKWDEELPPCLPFKDFAKKLKEFANKLEKRNGMMFLDDVKMFLNSYDFFNIP